MDQGVVRAEDREALVDLEAKRKFPALGVIIPQDLQGIDIARIAPNQALKKSDLDIEFALFEPIQLFPDRRLFGHNIAGPFCYTRLRPSQADEKQMRAFLCKQTMDQRNPDFKLRAKEIIGPN